MNFEFEGVRSDLLQEKIERALAVSLESVRSRNYTDEMKKKSDCLKLFLAESNVPLSNQELFPPQIAKGVSSHFQPKNTAKTVQEVHAVPCACGVRLVTAWEHLCH